MAHALKSAPLGHAAAARPPAARRANSVLDRHGLPGPVAIFGVEAGSAEADEALATLLMDAYRATRDPEAFEALVGFRRDFLLRRVRFRIRQLRAALDADEVFQDVLVNVYRYPDRFDARRPGAFRAWVSTIIDNAIRRRFRKRASAPDLVLTPDDELCRAEDVRAIEPVDAAVGREAGERAAGAVGILLAAYWQAYASLNERERLVLHLVEVEGRRYAEIAERLGIRPEALKMVVFRARRRIHDRLTVMFARVGNQAALAEGERED
jgi:RNA polymerase sigma factor (sigma-70 family)